MAEPSQVTQQAAAIPIKDGQICLVTSSSGKRWVIPKGVIDEGKSATETALQEAWEEAGLLVVLGGAAGTYQYEQCGGTCLATVFRMQVNEVRDDWPEAAVRKRTWVGLDEAVEMVEEEGLRDILRHALADTAPLAE